MNTFLGRGLDYFGLRSRLSCDINYYLRSCSQGIVLSTRLNNSFHGFTFEIYAHSADANHRTPLPAVPAVAMKPCAPNIAFCGQTIVLHERRIGETPGHAIINSRLIQTNVTIRGLDTKGK